MDWESAMKKGVSLHGDIPAMERYVFHVTLGVSYRQMPHPFYQFQNEAGGRSKLGLHPDLKNADPARHLAIARMGSLNVVSKKMEEGAYCLRCVEGFDLVPNWPMYHRRLFTTDTFKDHIKDCEDHIKDCGDIENSEKWKGLSS